jgi:alpha-galactosidase
VVAAPVALTPKAPATPRINGARVFGVRPGNPFLFFIAATGDRPIKYSADNLPTGLTLDSATGRITGALTNKGETTVTLRAENKLGKSERKLRIVCGDTIALTPPLGWNSWNCFASAVDDSKVRAAADAMVASGLINHGWTYINIDDCWEAGRDASGFINSNEKFPDMKALGEYIHGKGLKFGIYSSPGPKTCARFTASYQHEDQDAQRYGEWGVDYVKYDWCSYGGVALKITQQRYAALLPDDAAPIQALTQEKAKLDTNRKRTVEESARLKQVNTELDALYGKMNPEEKKRIDLEILQMPYKVFRASLDKVKRDIVYSFCQYGMGNVWEWGQQLGGNCWRTTGDIRDTWGSMAGIGFKQAGHETFAGPGHWNDPDMLTVGQVGWGPKLHPTHLTADEQYTHISLWSLLASPLLIGCDMSQLDPFTFGLLSNDEVLDVNQDPLGRPAGRVAQTGTVEIWVRNLEDGSKAVGLFNLGAQETKVVATWHDLGISGKQTVRDLWRQKDLGGFETQFETTVPSHGVVLVRIQPDSH